MTRATRHLATALACLLMLGVAGCGSSNEPKGEKLPRATVAELNKRLDEIQNRYSDGVDNNNVGACNDIQNDSLPAVSKLIDGLPSDTDSGIKDALTSSFQRLQELAQDGCSTVEKPQTNTETVPQETVPTETVPPETTPTETTPAKTTPTKTTPTKTTPQNQNQNGGGGTSPGAGGGAEAPKGGN